MMKQLLILKNGQPQNEIRPFYGNFEDHFLRAIGLTRHDAQIIDMTKNPVLPKWERIAGIIISGSLKMLTEHESWMEAEADWIRAAVSAEIPILGVCFGHQMLAYALGGRVRNNPHGPEIGTVVVHLTPRAGDDFLFMDVPSPLAVQTAHSQSVIELPPNAVLLAGNEHDGHQAFRIGQCAWGLQFHPEFEADLTRTIISSSRELLIENNQDPATLLSRCRNTPQATDIMKRFGLLFRKEIQ